MYVIFVNIFKLFSGIILKRVSELLNFVWQRMIFRDLLLAIRMQKSRNKNQHKTSPSTMYTFRPYQLSKVEYKCYKGLYDKGINTYPKPRSGHRIVCNDSDIYCFGGFNPDISVEHNQRARSALLFQELWKFDLFTQKWSIVFGQRDVDDMPHELASNALCMKDDMIVVFGGTGYPFGQACSNKCFLMFPYRSPKTISMLDTSGNKPEPKYGQSIVLHERYLYVIGGTSGYDYSCDIYRLDLITKDWECISICRDENLDDPKGRYRHEVACDDQHIFVLGGGTATKAYDLEVLPAFNMELGKWEHIQTKPDPSAPVPGFPGSRKCHSCVQYTNNDGQIEVIVAGGNYSDLKFFNDIWKLNLSTLEWRLFRTASLPFPLYFHDAATSGNGLMYVFGGIEVQEAQRNTRTNKIYKMWTTIPKLSEICWDAMLTYHPKLPSYSTEQLCEIGIPKRFVNRIDRTEYYSRSYSRSGSDSSDWGSMSIGSGSQTSE